MSASSVVVTPCVTAISRARGWLEATLLTASSRSATQERAWESESRNSLTGASADLVHVLVGNVPEEAHDRIAGSRREPRLDAYVLEDHRVALLRHDAAFLHEIVGEHEEPHFGGCLVNHVGGKAPRVGEDELQRLGGTGQPMRCRDGLVAVGDGRAETQEMRGAVAVDGETRAGDRAGPEGAVVGGSHGRDEGLGPFQEIEEEGAQVVGHRRDVGGLPVRGEDGELTLAGASALKDRPCTRGQAAHEIAELALQGEPEDRRVHVVSAARRVQGSGAPCPVTIELLLVEEGKVFQPLGEVIRECRAGLDTRPWRPLSPPRPSGTRCRSPRA